MMLLVAMLLAFQRAGYCSLGRRGRPGRRSSADAATLFKCCPNDVVLRTDDAAAMIQAR